MNGGTLVLSLVADATNLYFAAAVPDGASAAQDQVFVAFDVDRNGGDPDTPDRQYLMQRQAGTLLARTGSSSNGDGVGWPNAGTTAGVGALQDNGASYSLEVRIPRSELSGSPLRVYFQANDFGRMPPSVRCPDVSANTSELWHAPTLP
jgi:hypothetical protein